MTHRYCMTLEEIKSKSMVAGLEGLGGYHYHFDPDVFADLLVREISKWGEMNGAVAPGVDEEALREHLGMDV